MRRGKKDIAAGIAFVALIVGFILLVNSITTTSDLKETEMVYDAVKNAALTCYAAEGTYPDSLQYLRDGDTLASNQARLIVEADEFAATLMPAITVWERGNNEI